MSSHWHVGACHRFFCPRRTSYGDFDSSTAAAQGAGLLLATKVGKNEAVDEKIIVRHCLCLLFQLSSWLRHCLCLVFSLPPWLSLCLYLRSSSESS